MKKLIVCTDEDNHRNTCRQSQFSNAVSLQQGEVECVHGDDGMKIRQFDLRFKLCTSSVFKRFRDLPHDQQLFSFSLFLPTATAKGAR